MKILSSFFAIILFFSVGFFEKVLSKQYQAIVLVFVVRKKQVENKIDQVNFSRKSNQ